MKFLPFAFIILLCFNLTAQELSIIPQPVSIQQQTGSFTLKNSFSIGLSSLDPNCKRVADYLAKKILTSAGFSSTIGKIERASTIRFHLLAKSKNSEIGNEGYLLKVYTDSVSISANE